MLLAIKNNLSHLNQQNGPDGFPANSGNSANSANSGVEERQSSISSNSSSRNIEYTKAALAKIKESLDGFEINDSSTSPAINSQNGLSEVNPHFVRQLKQMGYHEEVAVGALRVSGNKSVDCALDILRRLSQGAVVDGRNGYPRAEGLSGYGKRVVRKPSFEDKYQTGSSINSENSSVRSESPTASSHLQSRMPLVAQNHVNTQNLAVPGIIADRATPPPLPPRGMQLNGRGTTPPPPPPSGLGHAQQKLPQKQMQDMLRKMSHSNMLQGHVGGNYGGRLAMRQQGVPAGTTNQIFLQNNSHNPAVLPHAPGRPLQTSPVVPLNGPLNPGGAAYLSPPYSVSVPTQLYDQSQINMVQSDNSPLSSHSSSPAPTPLVGQPLWPSGPGGASPVQGINGQWTGARPAPMSAWSARHPQIYMQKANSREVQKPVLQTATAPLSPPHSVHSDEVDMLYYQSQTNNYVSSVQAQVNTPQVPPKQHTLPPGNTQGHNSGNVQIEITHKPTAHQMQNVSPRRTDHTPQGALPKGNPGTIQIHIQNQGANMIQIQRERGYQSGPYHPALSHTPNSTPRSESPVPRMMNQSPMSIISTTSTPSTNSDIPDKPPPPYPGLSSRSHQHALQYQALHLQQVEQHTVNQHLDEDYQTTSDLSHNSPSLDSNDTDEKASISSQSEASSMTSNETQPAKHLCTSPKPQRKADAYNRDAQRRETQVRHFSPQAFKFFIEQHVENVIKSQKQRELRRDQLESEMAKVDLGVQAQSQMRKMLYQKESNYIRLKRAKMDKSMFQDIKILGIGAFGEVALVQKKDTGYLYAMKKLRKRDVLQKNQVAHVKAERDILAEADNEWVVKLYFSFQDADNLYFVMDYIPGGDMMSLLIKFGIFEEPLARFYIAELVLAIESVHRMGFIHRDIKPDNILIDKDGHIKLTDFGLCTGFRWTHNSKYYQKGNHGRQDSMDAVGWTNDCSCEKEVLKPLERRKQKHQRCLAHSLVGTPNYIAPEVLLREGYKRSCDWWSVGVILYEMLVGQPPFLANTPAETQLKVIHWDTELHIPSQANLSEDARDLILNLCCSSDRRMGNNDVDEIKRHRFFNAICFEGLRQQKAPHVPQIRSPTDTSNFDPVDQDKLKDSGCDTQKRDGTYENGKHPEHAFFEFTFRRFFDECGHPFMPRHTEEMMTILMENNEHEQEVDESNESNSPVYV